MEKLPLSVDMDSSLSSALQEFVWEGDGADARQARAWGRMIG